MSTLYKQRGIWYFDITIQNKRIRKSLHTSHLPTARKLVKAVELEVIKDVLLGKTQMSFKQVSIKELYHSFIGAEHNWANSTAILYKERITAYIENGLPINPSTKAMTIRCLNKMYKWAYDNKLCRELKKIDGGSKWECRMRTFTENEMKLIMNEVTPHHFQLFVRFAYYTGARRSEIACLSEDNVREEYVAGKTGKRKIKLNSQARLILSKLDELWAYRPPYISQVFKKNLRRLNIKNGRFHDLRRTFGLNLIKQGMPIYEVSKLLGHASVRTTEKHYAPLLVTEIADFQL